MGTVSTAARPRHNIVQTEKGWLLVIQSDDCSVMQLFSSASSAKLAVERMLEFFDSMSAQSPGRAA